MHSWPEAQAAQLLPPVPQYWLVSPGWHVLVPSQQPDAHELESQTHWLLPLHSWPVAHVAQVPPPVPQYADVLPGSHVSPLQQPDAHEFESQTHVPVVLSHLWPESQAAQALPPFPHWPRVSLESATHVPLLQQPSEHEVVSQPHWPEAHAWP